MNRTLSRWSPNSLAAMTRQPACGTRRFARSERASPAVALGGDGRGAHWRPPAGRAPGGRLPFQPGGLDRRALDRGAVDVVERRHDRPERRQAEARARPRRRGCPAGRGPRHRPGGRGPATSRCPPAAPRPTRPTRSPRSAVPARSTSAGVGSSSPTSMIAVPSPNWAASSSTVPTPISRPGGEDPDPVADRLDLGQQVAREQDRQPALVDEPAQELEDLDDAERVDRRGRLVEDQQVGRLDQRIGDAEPLAHAARVGLDPVVGAIGRGRPGRGPRRSPSRPRPCAGR